MGKRNKNKNKHNQHGSSSAVQKVQGGKEKQERQRINFVLSRKDAQEMANQKGSGTNVVDLEQLKLRLF